MRFLRFPVPHLLPLRAVAPILVYGLVAAIGATMVAHAAHRVAEALIAADRDRGRVGHVAPPVQTVKAASLSIAPAAVERRIASFIPTNDDWASKLQDPAFWAKRRAEGNGFGSKSKPTSTPASWGERSNLGQPASSGNTSSRGRSAPAKAPVTRNSDDEDTTYRTMCVRTCDGAYFPVSFATTRDQFEADAERCDKSCSGGRLFYYKNPGANIEDMTDLKGVAYSGTPNAFLFRTTYDAQCKCRAHPWEEVSRDRHKIYALEVVKAKGNASVSRELDALKTKVQKADVQQAKINKTASGKGTQEKPRQEAKAPGATALSVSLGTTAPASTPAPSKTDATAGREGKRAPDSPLPSVRVATPPQERPAPGERNVAAAGQGRIARP